jgi:hypothetical protein
MSKGTTVLTLAKPTANLATPATFTAALEGVAQPVGNLDLSKAKVTITRKRLTIAKVKLTLTDTAAAVMNGLFDNPGFKAGDLVGTATLAAKVVK